MPPSPPSPHWPDENADHWDSVLGGWAAAPMRVKARGWVRVGFWTGSQVVCAECHHQAHGHQNLRSPPFCSGSEKQVLVEMPSSEYPFQKPEAGGERWERAKWVPPGKQG